MNEPQTNSTVNSQIKWDKKKTGILILAVLLLIATILFQLASGKVRQAAEQSLLQQANEAINGQILVGDIHLSILGYVEAKEVQVLDKAGKPLAQIDRVHIRYNWSDLLKGQLGPQLITGVTVQKPELWVTYRQDQLSWDGLLKATPKEQTRFAGSVKIQNGTLHLDTDFFTNTVGELAGILDFHQEDQIGISATGKVDQAALKLDGQWASQGVSEITVAAAGMELAKLGLTAADDPIQLTDGRLDQLTIKIGNQVPAGPILLQTLSGNFSGVNTTGALVLTQGSAQFEKQGDAIWFTNGQALYKGQSIAAAGQVLSTPSGEKTLDFDVQMPAGDPSALLPSLQAGGYLAAQGKVTGSVLAPLFSGSFTLGSLQFGNMMVDGISGTFSYAQQTLKLLTAKGSTIGGSVMASGTIYPDTEQYHLSIAGSGLDSSRLTEKDVKGPLSMTGTAAGSGTDALVQGSFTIANGSAYGISFRTLTGDFIKRGSAEAEVSNLAMKTDFGVFYPEQLSQSMLEKLQERNLPTTKAEVKEKVTEKLTEKVMEKLLR